MENFILSLIAETNEIVFNEMYDRFVKSNHINLLQLFSPSINKKIEYNFIPTEDEPYVKKAKNFLDNIKEEMEKGGQTNEELIDRLNAKYQEFFLEICDNLESELLPNDETKEEVKDIQVKRLAEAGINYKINPLEELGSKVSDYIIKNGIKYFSEVPKYIFDQNLNHFRVNENSDDDNYRSFHNYRAKINIKDRRVSSLNDGNGYVIPVYGNSTSVWVLKDEYEKIRSSIDSDSSVLDALTLGQFRDLLEKQLNRQFSVISELNECIIDYLYEFYVIVESNYLESRNQLTNPLEARDQFLDLFQILVLMNRINNDFSSDSHTEDNFKQQLKILGDIPYAHKGHKEILANRLEKVFYKKIPILDVCSQLIGKLTICENLLEDLLLGKSLKNFQEFNDMLEKERSKKRAPYGFHESNWEWIVKTHGEQLNEMPNPNQAVGKTVNLYINKFGYPIGDSTVGRIYKKYK